MRSRCGFVVRSVSFHILLLLFALPALTRAQETRATLTGTVKDPQGRLRIVLARNNDSALVYSVSPPLVP